MVNMLLDNSQPTKSSNSSVFRMTYIEGLNKDI